MKGKMKAAAATQSLSTPVMTSSATQMHFRYAIYNGNKTAWSPILSVIIPYE